MPQVLDALLSAFRETAADLPDRRTGRNTRYAVSDAAGCALSCFFTRCESFLASQRSMERDGSRSNCRTLFGVGRIPCDNRIRNLLDGLDPAAFDPLFRLGLETVAARGALKPFQRLGERLLVALDGIRFHCSDTVRCQQCSVRHLGSERRPQYFHTMVAATVVADGHATVLPLMPEFVCPQQDAAATRADMSEDERKRDCERNAAKRWLAAHGAWLQACRPVLPGDDLYCCQPLCEAAAAAGMDYIRVCKPGSRKHLYEVLESRRASGTVSAGRTRCPCARAATPCRALGSSTPWSATASAPAPAASSPVSRSPRTMRSGSRGPAGRAGRSRTRASTAWRGTAATSGTARPRWPTCWPC